ncbi:MAG TPA: diguanylate cyclase [Candidatus Polarisedimenticolaceae bacterium]|nr:diguanylate cyclase [Candidatus Polarisedimenticolaceae bacterium]
MITREEIERVRDDLIRLVDEDAYNTRRLLDRLESIAQESGVGAHAALITILTRLVFDEAEARRHWTKIIEHREWLTSALGREVAVRVATLDYFVHVNRHLLQPTLIDLDMVDAHAADASIDRLTGLSNDRVFRVGLQTELRRARRYRLPAAVLLFDVDDFAAANHRFGRLVADRLLREAAILLKNKTRDIDVAARPGEDEIAMLLPETDRNGALLVAERCRVEFERYFAGREAGGRPAALTVSGGVAAFPEDATSPEELLERAAQALYQAKATGRNAVQSYRPERRHYLRFEFEAGRFEVEVLAPRDVAGASLCNVSRNGILFLSPEPIDVGESIEIRLLDAHDASGGGRAIRGTVVRLEQLPSPAEVDLPGEDAARSRDRFEIGVALALGADDGPVQLSAFLESLQTGRLARRG